MRVLFTVQPTPSHLRPLVPIAQVLTEAGHEVAVCSAPSFRPKVEEAGVTHFDAGLDWLGTDQSTWGPFGPPPPPGPEFAAFAIRLFADITAREMVPDLLSIAQEWGADLVIRELLEFGGCLAAECLGIPHASVGNTAFGAVDIRAGLAQPLSVHRVRFGLDPDPATEMPYRYLHLCFVPPRWDGPTTVRPPNTHFLRYPIGAQTDAELPAWFKHLPSRPTVLASLGTVFNQAPGVLEAIVAGLRDEQINLIVAIGADRDPASFGPQPSNVHLVPHVPQAELVSHCDLLVTHGGMNSIKEALGEGVPMVVVPITADQWYSAERCAALGVARVIEDPGLPTPARVQLAARAVLADPDYRAKARGFGDEMKALPGAERLLGLLEDLAAPRGRDSSLRGSASAALGLASALSRFARRR